MNYSISLSGTPYTLSTSDDAQIAAIAACRVKYNEALPQTVKDGENDVPNPALIATDAAYLEYVFGHWAGANPGFTNEDLQTAALGAFASYAGQNPPEQIVESVPLTGDALKAALRAYAAEKRWLVEIGGCAWNGQIINTDRESQSKMLAEFVAIGGGIRTDGEGWKFRTGFLPLTNIQMMEVALAARAHVAAAFAAEDAIVDQIDADTITTIAEIDTAFSS